MAVLNLVAIILELSWKGVKRVAGNCVDVIRSGILETGGSCRLELQKRHKSTDFLFAMLY